jgi:tetratricopeptide (TPR) repeat protein
MLLHGARWALVLGCLATASGIVGPSDFAVAQERPAAQASDAKSPKDREAELRAEIQGKPDDADLQLQLGNALYDQGKRNEAQIAYEKAVELRPDFVKALVNLGVVLNEGAESEKALTYFERALTLSPKDVTVLCNKAQALYALQRYPEAIDLYRMSIELEPANQLPHYLLGVAFADAGIYREAIVEWQRVVEIDPNTEAAGTAAEGIKVLQGLIPGASPRPDDASSAAPPAQPHSH